MLSVNVAMEITSNHDVDEVVSPPASMQYVVDRSVRLANRLSSATVVRLIGAYRRVKVRIR